MARQHRIRVGLSKKQICFIDKISKDGKLHRSCIIRAFLAVGAKLNIDITKVKTEKELQDRIEASFKADI